MSKKVFTNATIITGTGVIKGQSLLIENGKIVDFISNYTLPKDIETIDLQGNTIVPGFLDLQVNGGGGAFFTNHPSESNVETIFQAHLQYGTTGYLPTVISTSMENILDCIEVTRACMKDGKHGVLGMHLEGPFFNPSKRGAHPEKYIHKPTDKELHLIAEKGEGIIKLMTFAPERFEDHQIKILLDAGIKLSAGHSDANYFEACKGFDLGISCVTHLYNAMSQFTSRNAGLVGAFLDHDNIWGGIIVDGIHSEFASVRVAHKIKQGKLFLVSDASFLNHPTDNFEFDGFNIHLDEGKYLTETGALAGSSITQLDGLRNCVNHVGINLEEAVKMTSTYPAEFLGIDNVVGKIQKGNKADFVVLGKNLNLIDIYMQGEVLAVLN